MCNGSKMLDVASLWNFVLLLFTGKQCQVPSEQLTVQNELKVSDSTCKWQVQLTLVFLNSTSIVVAICKYGSIIRLVLCKATIERVSWSFVSRSLSGRSLQRNQSPMSRCHYKKKLRHKHEYRIWSDALLLRLPLQLTNFCHFHLVINGSALFCLIYLHTLVL